MRYPFRERSVALLEEVDAMPMFCGTLRYTSSIICHGDSALPHM